MPSAGVIVAGPNSPDTWFLKPPVPLDLFDWDDYPDMSDFRRWDTAVLMPGGPDGSTRVMQIGGSPTLPLTDDAVATTRWSTSPTRDWAGSPPHP